MKECGMLHPGVPAPVETTQKAFSLIELLVAIAIIAIIGAFAYPSYQDFVTRSKRTAGQAFLTQVIDRQVQFFADNKQYAGALSALGYAADSIGVNDEGEVVPDSDSRRIYVVSLTNTSAMTFTIAAAPALAQAAHDTKCGTLTLTHTGQKGHSGPGPNCW